MLSLDLLPGVALRLPEEDDADELDALIAANRDRLTPWMPWAATSNRESVLDFIRMGRRQLADNDGLQTVITIEGRIAGAVGVHGIDRIHRATSIGYWIGQEFEGRGAITAAVRAFTTQAFSGWGLNRMELRAATGNVRSRAVAERLGFVLEGISRQSWWVGETCQDMAIYAALAADWTG